MPKFSELLIEYLCLRDECQDDDRIEYEPICNRSARRDRMQQLENQMDELFTKDPS